MPPERTHSRISAAISVALGVAILAVTLTTSSLAPVLTIVLIGAGLIQLGLAVGLLRGSRAAWAFALSLDGVLAFAALLAIPAILRAKVPVALAALPALAALTAVVILAVASDELK